MEQTFMREQKVLPLVMSMSLPMVISMAVNSLYNIIDSYFVSRMGEQAITALSIVFPVQNLINAMAIGFGIGINGRIAFYLGANDQMRADRTAALGVMLSFLHGVFMMALCILWVPGFLKVFSSDPETIRLALCYSNRAFLFSPVITVGLCFEKIFQSLGKMKLTMVSMLWGCIVNIILDPIMIFGIGVFPPMGIAGAAYATGIGQCFTLLVYILLLGLLRLPIHIKWEHRRPDPVLIKSLYSTGIPAALNLALPSLLVSALNGILADFSETHVLVLGVYYKLQTFIYLTANGIIQGIRPLIGYNYGAGEYRRVKKICGTALAMNLAIMALGTILCWVMPDRLIGLFTDSTETIRIGVRALHRISLGFVVSAVSVTCLGALEGLGKGFPSLLLSLLRNVVFMIPAACLLVRFVGVDGVWWAFGLTELVCGAAAWYLYKKETPAVP